MRNFHLRQSAGRLASALRAHGGQVVYCCGVALALTAIAVAAEAYRSGNAGGEDAPALPTAEIAGAEEAREEAAEVAPVAPEGGQILRGWSEAPVWSAELGLWESHEAVDYRLPDGAATCLCAGTVRAVGKSGPLGGFVEVASGDLLLRYASIAPREDLSPGDELAPGDFLGTADASLPGERALGAHLHLEAWRGGEALNFLSLPPGD